MMLKIILSYAFGYLIPGFGHWYSGNKIKGFLFFISIVPCYLLGYYLSGDVVWYEFNILALLGTVVNYFNGLSYFLTLFDFLPGGKVGRFYEIGKTFMLVSGALNILVLIYLKDEFKKMRLQCD